MNQTESGSSLEPQTPTTPTKEQEARELVEDIFGALVEIRNPIVFVEGVFTTLDELLRDPIVRERAHRRIEEIVRKKLGK